MGFPQTRQRAWRPKWISDFVIDSEAYCADEKFDILIGRRYFLAHPI